MQERGRGLCIVVVHSSIQRLDRPANTTRGPVHFPNCIQAILEDVYYYKATDELREKGYYVQCDRKGSHQTETTLLVSKRDPFKHIINTQLFNSNLGTFENSKLKYDGESSHLEFVQKLFVGDNFDEVKG